METIPGYEISSWEKGYGDLHLKLDTNSIRIADWLDKTAIIILGYQWKGNHLWGYGRLCRSTSKIRRSK